MAATVHVMLLFAIATRSVVTATIPEVGENGDVMSILKTMQVKYLTTLKQVKCSHPLY